MYRKSFLKAVCILIMSGNFFSVYAEECLASDGLLSLSGFNSDSQFNDSSSVCTGINTEQDFLSISAQGMHQLELYKGSGVASVGTNTEFRKNPLVKIYHPEEFYSSPIIDSVVTNIGFIEEIDAIAADFNIDPLLLHAIAHVESRHNPNAVSPAGARGLMQVMPGTARQLGLADPEQLFDPQKNLRVSSTYLRKLYDVFGNNLELVLAAYNAGEAAVIKHGYQIPPYKETRGYVRKVLEKYQELTQTITF